MATYPELPTSGARCLELRLIIKNDIYLGDNCHSNTLPTTLQSQQQTYKANMNFLRSGLMAVRPATMIAGRSSLRVARPNLAVQSVGAKRFYHPKVLDHYNNPRNVGSLNKNDTDVGTGLVGAPACGDVMKLQIKVDDNGIISDVKFKTFGCGSAIASSSYVTELVRGMSLEEAGKIKNTVIAKELSLPPVKLHCSMLAEDAIKSAIKDYKSKRKSTDLGVVGTSSPATHATASAAA